ncbi:hypothetical protein AK812_SmicGene5634 [Symbiodinium microadriaticum]|uniref:Uncharacterized protein n=1 Tax=Symbiodinium microadriaticum TaxID=2951 RepID=A0A1Q9ETB7_SYMMI|nr:hypothetical protein AK812_SmicGene5634 [Symbiodinium microadriaticum]
MSSAVLSSRAALVSGGCLSALTVTAIATIAWLGRRRSKAGKNAVAEEVNLRELPEAEVPKRLRPEFYFDFQAYPFAHSKLLQEAHDVIQVLELLPKYLKEQLQLEKESLVSCTRGSVSCPCVPATASPTVLLEDPCTVIVEPDKMLLDPATAAQEALSALLLRKGAQILGGIIDLRKGPVALGPGAVVEPGAFVAGPAMIGAGTVVRSGAYIRGDVLVGEKAVLRGELKNSLVMDKAELAHPGCIELEGGVPNGPESGFGVMAGELQRRTGRAVVAANYYGQEYEKVQLKPDSGIDVGFNNRPASNPTPVEVVTLILTLAC